MAIHCRAVKNSLRGTDPFYSSSVLTTQNMSILRVTDHSHVHLHHFSKIKSPKEVTKQRDSSVFLLFLLGDRTIREAQKHVDPVDPDSDPEHCSLA